MAQDIQTIQPWLDEACRRLKTEFNPDKVILFGSWASGEATRHSDIDLFVVCQSSLNPIDRIGKVLSLLIDSPRAVDAIVYTPDELSRCKDRPFIAQLLREGKVLYEREKAASRG